MTHGSSFVTVGRTLVSLLDSRLLGWKVRYGEPVEATDVTSDAGESRAVWIGTEGDSEVELISMGRTPGMEETGSITVVFQYLVPRSGGEQEVVDDEVALAAGELVDLVSEDARPADALGDGWGSLWWSYAGTARRGGLTPDGNQLGRRLEVVVRYVAARC